VTRVGLVAKPDASEAQRVVLTLVDWLTARGLTAVLEKETAALAPTKTLASALKADLPALVDALVVLGGD
jgi:NAD kinase